MISLTLTLHVLATVIWVGGMFFAHMALRPVAHTLLAPPQRLPLLAAVLGRFFVWVWVAVLALLGSGGYMIHLLGGAAIYVHVMTALGAVMMTLFAFLFFVPYRALREALGRDDFKEAGRRMALIRAVVAVNLVLGLCTTVVAVAGKYL